MKPRKDDESIANSIGTLVFAIIILAISIEWEIVSQKLGGLFK